MTKTRYVHINQKDEIRQEVLLELQKSEISSSLKKSFIVYNKGEHYQDNVIGLLLTNLCSQMDIQDIKLAQNLVKNSVPLPPPRRTAKQFKTHSEYLQHLARNPHDFFIVLHQSPDLINKPDENKRTLLHHAADSLHTLGDDGAKIMLFLLLQAPKLDFTLQDKHGYTPLQLALKRCKHPVADQVVYPALKKAYIQHSKAEETPTCFLANVWSFFVRKPDVVSSDSQSELKLQR